MPANRKIRHVENCDISLACFYRGHEMGVPMGLKPRTPKCLTPFGEMLRHPEASILGVNA
jgi:hypothetical protein